MIDIAGFWVEARSWFLPAVDMVQAQPVFLAPLLVPLIASLLSRSLIAILISALAAAIGLLALRAQPGATYAWSVMLAVSCTGLLAALLAAFKRRAERHSRAAARSLAEARQELEVVRGKHEREVQWRQAGEKMSGRTSDAVPS